MTSKHSLPRNSPWIRHPILARHARYRWDKIRQQHQIVYSEGLLVLNETGAAIVKRCDGRACEALIEDLASAFPEGTLNDHPRSTHDSPHNSTSADTLAAEVKEYLDRLASKGIVIDDKRIDDTRVRDDDS